MPAASSQGERSGKGRRLGIFRTVVLLSTVFFAGIFCAALVSWSAGGGLAPVAVSVASRIIPLLGDKLPSFNSPYGRLHIRSARVEDGDFFEIECGPCRIPGKYIGPTPLLIPAGKLSGSVSHGRFRGQAEAETLRLRIEGSWDGRTFDGSFEIPDTPIAKLYQLVGSIVPELQRATIEGNISGAGVFEWPKTMFRWKPRVSKFRVSGMFNPSVYRQGKFQYPAKDGAGNPIELESGEGTAEWLPLEAAGKFLPEAIIAAEDGAFYSHPGYDLAGMDEAFRDNQQTKSIRRGGSTITQQLAKNLFLTSERSYARKLRELLYAVNLEQLGKKRILELYLNVVEWAPELHGARKAAQLYFGKSPAELLPEEAAWLAGILRSPKRGYEREFLRRNPSLGRVSVVLGRMNSLGPEERALALEHKLTFAVPRS